MEFYPEMFFSGWHIIAVILTLIAFIGLLIGGYPRGTVVKATLISFFIYYIVVTIPVAYEVNQDMERKAYFNEALTEVYENNKGSGKGDYLAAYVGSTEDEDGDITVKVYAGDYHHSKSFEGSLSIIIYGENDVILNGMTYEDVSLEPGEKIEVDSYFSNDEAPKRFRYYFEE